MGYDYRVGRGFGAGEVAALLVLGVAAGAVGIWLLASNKRGKISLGPLGELRPHDWLAKAAQALQEGRERLIHGVEERAGGPSA